MLIGKYSDFYLMMVVYLMVTVSFFGLFPNKLSDQISQINIYVACLIVLAGLQMIFYTKSFTFPKPITFLLILMFCSSFWSESPTQTISNSFYYLLLLLAASLLANYQEHVRNALSIAIAISILIATLFLFSDFSNFNVIWSRSFSGIYTNSNGFAFVLICGLPALLSQDYKRPSARVAQMFLICLVILFLFISGSETELGALIATLATLALIRKQKILKIGSVFVIPLVSVCFLLLLVLFPPLLKLIGKDPTIAGRTTLWSMLFKQITEGSILGMGWTNSWPENSQLFLRISKSGMPLHHAHNEMLNWLLTLGVFGLLIVLWIYSSMIVGGVQLINSGNKGLGTWVVLTSVAFFVRGLSDISETNTLGWFIWVTAYLAMILALNQSEKNKNRFTFLPKIKPSL